MEVAFEILAVNGEGLDWNFSENEIGLQGRAYRNISVGDVLVAQSGDRFKVLKTLSRSREEEGLSLSVACALVVKVLGRDAMFYHEAQKLAGRQLYAASQ